MNDACEMPGWCWRRPLSGTDIAVTIFVFLWANLTPMHLTLSLDILTNCIRLQAACPSSLCAPGGHEILVIFYFSECKTLPVSFIHSFIHSTNNY